MGAGRAERVEDRAASWRVRRARARGPGSMAGWEEESGLEGAGGCVSGEGSAAVVAVGIVWCGRGAWCVSLGSGLQSWLCVFLV